MYQPPPNLLYTMITPGFFKIEDLKEIRENPGYTAVPYNSTTVLSITALLAKN